MSEEFKFGEDLKAQVEKVEIIKTVSSAIPNKAVTFAEFFKIYAKGQSAVANLVRNFE